MAWCWCHLPRETLAIMTFTWNRLAHSAATTLPSMLRPVEPQQKLTIERYTLTGAMNLRNTSWQWRLGRPNMLNVKVEVTRMMSPTKEGHQLPKTEWRLFISPSARKVTCEGQQTPCRIEEPPRSQLGSKVHIHAFFFCHGALHLLIFGLLYQLGLSYSFSMMESNIADCSSYLYTALKEHCQTYSTELHTRSCETELIAAQVLDLSRSRKLNTYSVTSALVYCVMTAEWSAVVLEKIQVV